MAVQNQCMGDRGQDGESKMTGNYFFYCASNRAKSSSPEQFCRIFTICDAIVVKSSGHRISRYAGWGLNGPGLGRARHPMGSKMLSFLCPKMANLRQSANFNPHSRLIIGQNPWFGRTLGCVAQTAVPRALVEGCTPHFHYFPPIGKAQMHP